MCVVATNKGTSDKASGSEVLKFSVIAELTTYASTLARPNKSITINQHSSGGCAFRLHVFKGLSGGVCGLGGRIAA